MLFSTNSNPGTELASISVSPTSKEYDINDMYRKSDFRVTANYDDGSSKDVSNSAKFFLNGNTEMANTYSFSSVGDKSVTVSYTEDDITKTCTLVIKITQKVAPWSSGSDSDIAKAVENAASGSVRLSDYWRVGDERNVTVNGSEETFILMGVSGNGFVVGTLPLGCIGRVNMDNNGNGSWDNDYSTMHTTCDDFKGNLPATFAKIFKRRNNNTMTKSYGNQTSNDYFAPPSEKEVIGTSKYADGEKGSQLSWFQDEANRKKYDNCWTRSSNPNYTATYNENIYVGYDGTTHTTGANSPHRVALIGKI